MKIIDAILGRNKKEETERVPPGLISTIKDVEEFKSTYGFKTKAKSIVTLIEYIDSLPEQKWQVNILGKKGIRKVEFYDMFPTFDDVMPLYEDWGGGKYIVILSSPKKCKFGHYIFEGEETKPQKVIIEPEEEDEQRGHKLKIDYKPKNLQEAVLINRLKEGDQKVTQAVIEGELKKQGLMEDDSKKDKDKKKKSVDELIAEEMEKDPAIRKRFIDAEIEKRLGKSKDKKEPTPLEQAEQMADYWGKMREIFGDKKDTGTNWGDVFKEFIKQGGVGELIGTVGAVMKEDNSEAAQRAALQAQILREQQELESVKMLSAPEIHTESELEQVKEQINTSTASTTRGIGEKGSVIFAGKPVVTTSQSQIPVDIPQKMISRELLEFLPTIPTLIQSMTPDVAFNALNSMSPEYCDVLYNIDIENLNKIIKYANTTLPDSKGKLNNLMTEQSQKWLEEFLKINRENIDKETVLEPTPVVLGEES